MDPETLHQWLDQFSKEDRRRIVSSPAIYAIMMTAKDVDDLNRVVISHLLRAIELSNQIALDKAQKTFPVFVNGHGMMFYKPQWMPDGMVEDGFRRWKERKKTAAEGN